MSTEWLNYSPPFLLPTSKSNSGFHLFVDWNTILFLIQGIRSVCHHEFWTTYKQKCQKSNLWEITMNKEVPRADISISALNQEQISNQHNYSQSIL